MTSFYLDSLCENYRSNEPCSEVMDVRTSNRSFLEDTIQYVTVELVPFGKAKENAM